MAAACANPLLLEWIKEIYDIARERNSKGVTTYKKAYDSMKACPLTFSHPSEAQQLDGIGPKICDRLTEKLVAHCQANGLPAPKKPRGKARTRLPTDDLDTEAPPAKKARKATPYVPSLRSGPYAIILALSSLPEDSLQSLSKKEVIELAQEHCDSSFTVPSEAGKFYTAWNSMTTLVNKDLVQEKGRPLRKYLLTEEGWEVAKRIITVQHEELGAIEGWGDAETCGDLQAAESSKTASRHGGGYLNLGDALESENNSRPQTSLANPAETSVKPAGVPPDPVGQRLGGGPNDKYGTFSKSRERESPASRNFVELLSSPEPDAVQNGPWVSSTTGQNSRSLTSKPDAKPSFNDPKPAPPPTSQASTRPQANPNPSKPISPFPNFSPIILPPGSFTVHLVLDNREVRAKGDYDYIASSLTKRGAAPLVRPLDLGDVLWIAKCHSPKLLSQHGEEGDEIALDYIVERKRLDDLVGSITDGRFQEQKFRLRKSGVKNVIYLIEDFSLSTEKTTRFHDAIQSAITSTQVVNGYFVKRTQKLDDTITYLARLTRTLKAHYEARQLHLLPTSILAPSTYLPLLHHLRTDPTHRHKTYNITFPAFASLASKSDTLTLRDVFLKMLMCTRGISGDKALAIQKVWKTPRAFVEAFEACAGQKEREAMVERELGGIVGRGKVKGVLGAKVAGVWGG